MYSPSRRIALTLALAFSLAGCGEQSKQYASSSAANTFFTVPNEWREISFEKLSAFEKKQRADVDEEQANAVIWQVAFTPAKKFKISKVYAIEAIDEPIVVARVRELSYEEGNDISYNALREIVLPFQTWRMNPDQAPPGFSVVNDYEISDQGVNGIRSVFRFDSEGKNQTLDQVALVSNDRRKIYILLSRCVTTCYTKNQKVIDEIVKSFTVRGEK